MLQHTATMLHYQIIKSPGILNNSLFITHRSDLLLAISWKRLTMWSPADAQNSLTKSNDHCNLCINELDTAITKVRDKMLQLATIVCRLYKKLNIHKLRCPFQDNTLILAPSSALVYFFISLLIQLTYYRGKSCSYHKSLLNMQRYDFW